MDVIVEDNNQRNYNGRTGHWIRNPGDDSL